MEALETNGKEEERVRSVARTGAGSTGEETMSKNMTSTRLESVDSSRVDSTPVAADAIATCREHLAPWRISAAEVAISRNWILSKRSPCRVVGLSHVHENYVN